MAKFLYQAKSLEGKILTGEIEAPDEVQARAHLRNQKLIPIKLAAKIRRGTPVSRKKKSEFDLLGPRKVSEKDLQAFTRQFATLINAGITVVDALEILSNGQRPGVLKKACQGVKQSIEGGRSLGDSMADHSNVFDRFYVNMVKAGEEAGVLSTILLRLSAYIEKSQKIKRQVKGALTYPTIVIVVAMSVLIGLLVFVVPRFQELWSSNNSEPPALTAMVVGISQFMLQKWYLIIGFFAAGMWALYMYFQTDDGKKTKDIILLRAPAFGPLFQKSAIARFTRTLSTLLGSGVSIIEALEISAKTSGNQIIENAIMQAKVSISKGQTIAGPLGKSKEIPSMVVQMIAVGENSGTLQEMLSKVADFYEEEVDVVVAAMSSIIEPLLMVFLGGIIAVIVIAMYLPIFNMANVVSGGG